MHFSLPTFALLLPFVSSLVSAGTENSQHLAQREVDPLVPQPTLPPTLLHQFQPRFLRGFRHRTTKKKTTTTKKAVQTTVAQGTTSPPAQITPPVVALPSSAVPALSLAASSPPPAADSSATFAAPSEVAPVESTPVVESSSVAAPVQTGAVNDGAGGVGGGGVVAPGAGSGGGDPQTSFTLDPSVINENFKDDGQNPPVAGQVASLTSSNNYINFCASQAGVPLTNGLQIKDGSCNQAPMGRILSINRIPSCKFVFPKNLDTVQASTPFTIQMKINNMNTGQFVNAQKAYFSAPAQVDDTGTVLGHSHVVIEQIDSLESTTVLNPLAFAFFKGLNSKANADGILTADVPAGLAAGFYKMSSINSAANHQPVLVAVAQHGSIDDAVYFSVTADGVPAVPAPAVSTPVVDTSPTATESAIASAVESAGSTESSIASAPAVPSAAVSEAASVPARRRRRLVL